MNQKLHAPGRVPRPSKVYSTNISGIKTRIKDRVQARSKNFSLETMGLVAQRTIKLRRPSRTRFTIIPQPTYAAQDELVTTTLLPENANALSNWALSSAPRSDKSLKKFVILSNNWSKWTVRSADSKEFSILTVYVLGYGRSEWQNLLKETICQVKYLLKCKNR